MDLVARSLEILRSAQAPNGAFPAATTYPTYQFCWFRDASYVAYALDRYGETTAAARFHTWAEARILAERPRIEAAIVAPHATAAQGLGIRARYPLDGSLADDPWPNFQLDGIGVWLWARIEHARCGGARLAGPTGRAIDLVARYLAALWDEPNYDCWEEAGERRHPSTWACIHAGLGAYVDATGAGWAENAAALLCEAIRTRGVRKGVFTKHEGADEVDANLLFLAVPRPVVPLEDAIFQRTLGRIERELVGGGVRRYVGDTFYGGGEWIVLAGFLGWCYAQLGRRAEARRYLAWMREQADHGGNLPEQVPANLNDPEMLRFWMGRWGPIATPLLWSHAMYLILDDELGER